MAGGMLREGGFSKMAIFVVIDAKRKVVHKVNCENLATAQRIADVPWRETDHGVVRPGIGITVYEFGMYVSPSEQHYFGLEGKLYAGNAVLYGFDPGGYERDMVDVPVVMFFDNAEHVEKAIKDKVIERPQMSVNGEVLWQWPNPRM
jgi:hypothetical protein